jgi:hypothetical protein
MNLTDAGVAAIGQLHELRQLSLRSCEVGDVGVSALSQCQKLTDLDISDTSVSDSSGANGFARIFSQQGVWRLRSLSMVHTDVGVNVLRAVGAACPQLCRLNVAECTAVTDDALKALVETTQGEHRGDSSSSAQREFESNNNGSGGYSNSSAGLTKSSPASLSPPVPSLLLSRVRLEEIGLAHCPNMGEEGVSVLLRTLPRLRRIDISGCNPTDTGTHSSDGTEGTYRAEGQESGGDEYLTELPGPRVREHVLRDWVHRHRAVEFIHTASPATDELMPT